MQASDMVILFAHLQPGLVGYSVTNPPKLIEVNAGGLAEAAKLLGIPILFSLVPSEIGEAHPLPSLESHAGEDNCFVQNCARPLMDEKLVSALEATGRRTLVIAGFATEAVVLFAALDAIEAGYDVVVALDASGGRSDRTEAAMLRRIERAGATVTAVVDIVLSSAPDFTTVLGREMMGVVRQMMAARA